MFSERNNVLLLVTHTNIIDSILLKLFTKLLMFINERLCYQQKIFVTLNRDYLFSYIIGVIVLNNVSCYAVFNWWLILSKQRRRFNNKTALTTSLIIKNLILRFWVVAHSTLIDFFANSPTAYFNLTFCILKLDLLSNVNNNPRISLQYHKKKTNKRRFYKRFAKYKQYPCLIRLSRLFSNHPNFLQQILVQSSS